MATNSKGMNQPGTDRGERGETGEKIPKSVKSSDSGGEKSKSKTNGVGMGARDDTGRSNGSKERGEFNSGRSESVCYSHKKGV